MIKQAEKEEVEEKERGGSVREAKRRGLDHRLPISRGLIHTN